MATPKTPVRSAKPRPRKDLPEALPKRIHRMRLTDKEKTLIEHYRAIPRGGEMRKHVRDIAEHHAGLTSKK